MFRYLNKVALATANPSYHCIMYDKCYVIHIPLNMCQMNLPVFTKDNFKNLVIDKDKIVFTLINPPENNLIKDIEVPNGWNNK